MGQKIKYDGREYDVDKLNSKEKELLKLLQFVTSKTQELRNMQVLLKQLKKTYSEDLKKEVLSNKTGFFFVEDE
jgi:hypothetical protein